MMELLLEVVKNLPKSELGQALLLIGLVHELRLWHKQLLEHKIKLKEIEAKTKKKKK
ncbi:hypothetical protein [Enterococcus cecorum]|uniref:hypothetical protein n=1 Tax=Enterococcus cecorum TaxID=44008 RepID=UPI003F24BE23